MGGSPFGIPVSIYVIKKAIAFKNRDRLSGDRRKIWIQFTVMAIYAKNKI
ncbi:MAG: hypothetical protein ACKO4S_01480 [Snowella sp.]